MAKLLVLNNLLVCLGGLWKYCNLGFPKLFQQMCDLLLHIVGKDRHLMGRRLKELKLRLHILNLLFLRLELKHKNFLGLHFHLKIFGKQSDFRLILNFLFHNNLLGLLIELLLYLVFYFLLFLYLCCNILREYLQLLFRHNLLVL